ncbi:MAG: hypothetical protein ABJB09_03125 [Verrucomicrobiota bacterium]
MFVLAMREQRLVIFIVIALVVVAWIKHRQDLKFNNVRPPAPRASPSLAPTPDD